MILQNFFLTEQMNGLRIVQHLRNIKLWELFYIYLWERLERRLTTHIFLTEGGVRKLFIYKYI